MSRKFLPHLFGPTETKAFSTGSTSWGTQVSRTSGSASVFGWRDRAADWDMDAVIAEGYERSVWVYRCVELISSSQSRLPFRIGADLGGDDQRVIDQHPLYRVLNRRANPLETGRAFRKRLSAQVLLSKRGAFVEVTRSAAGIITRLDLLDPSRVTPIPSSNGDYIKHFEYVRLDGQIREIPPERIRWVREPHPTDPFSGTTPLEAAGISVELDQLSRLYNVTFIKNDSRPGGVLAVDTDTLTEQEMARLESRFKGGAHTAGEMSVIASGPNGLKYVDTTTRPRDMAYSEAAANSKNEILSAFGIGESLLGNTSGRTFDNADQEEYNFWTKPMPPHLELIAGAFADDIGEEWEPFFDTSTVEALEAGRRRTRSEAREEFNAGLRSIDEYRPLADLPQVGNPQTRALWASPAKAPIPTDPRDAAALLGSEGGSPAEPGGQPAPGGDDLASAADAVDAARDLSADVEAATPADAAAAAAVAAARKVNFDTPVPSAAALAVDAAREDDSDPGPGAAADAVLAAKLETKATKIEAAPVDHSPADARYVQAEAALTGVLQALLARQRGVVEARLQSPKVRRGTRFWRVEGDSDLRSGADPIDMVKVVDVDRWENELATTVSPLIQDATAGAAEDLIDTFLAARLLVMADVDVDRLPQIAGLLTANTALEVTLKATNALRAWTDDMRFALDVEQHAADTIEDLAAAAGRFYADRGDAFARDLAGDLAHHAVNGGADAAAGALEPAGPGTAAIVRTWQSKRDERVRPSHVAVDGTTLPVGERFLVGRGLLLYPQDPSGPLEETINCRCRLWYRAPAAAKFTLANPYELTA